MAEAIVLPKMGLTADDGEVLRWLVGLGERVEQGQEIVEVETYKATLAVESPADGVLRAAIEAGTTVPAGAVIGIVADPDEPLDGLKLWSPDGLGDAEAVIAAEPMPSLESGGGSRAQRPDDSFVTEGGGGDGLRASPVARRLAREFGVDLARVEGSGPRGRITEKDVHAAASPSGSTPSIAPGDRRTPLTPMRRAIADLMTASAQVPQFTLEATVTISARRGLPPRSYSSLLIAACARSLGDFPIVNSSFDGDSLIQHAEINVGVAVALEQGLIVPVVRHAARRTLVEIDSERRRLTHAAQTGTLGATDLTGGTFTVSNLGPLGIERFRALVVPPQAAILAVGAIRQDRVAVSLSCDHRVLDGDPAARFLNRVVDRLEHLDWLDEER
jgi:pyruvate dehydrogenase E2 component (dihydrolipoamide acetyltransferase)